MELRICHLYPDVLNLYGDRGNIICMKKRLEWRGIDVVVEKSGIGGELSLADTDILFIGGGQDFEQEVLLGDLHTGKDAEIKAFIADGGTVLAICGGYQMLGQYYETHDGRRCDFIGVLDLFTVGSKERMIGNYVFSMPELGECGDIVAFENHSGKTYLGEGLSPLGTVRAGFGNNGEDKTEGARFGNVFGTYGHGSLLPKNPALCDLILKTAIERKYGSCDLQPLDDELENSARTEMAARILK